jgi:4'-phosphopantetheinyl transferase
MVVGPVVVDVRVVDASLTGAAALDVLGERLGVPRSELEISRLCAHCGDPDHGKPSVVGRPDVSFNVSHSGRHGLVAVTIGANVGVDVEMVRPRRYLERLATRTLAPDDLAAWCDAPAGERLERFLRAWTAKEAYLKALGVGLTRRLRDVPVEPSDWTIAPITLEGAVASVAVDATDAVVSVSDATGR